MHGGHVGWGGELSSHTGWTGYRFPVNNLVFKIRATLQKACVVWTRSQIDILIEVSSFKPISLHYKIHEDLFFK